MTPEVEGHGPIIENASGGWKDGRDVVLFLLGVGCLIWGVAFETDGERIVLFGMAATLMGIPGGLFAARNGKK